MTTAARGTGRGVGRARDAAPPPWRARTAPLAADQASNAPESQRGGERQRGAHPAAPAADEQIPGQTALELRPMQPTLWSL